MSGTRHENIYMAHLAEQGERYEDMVTYMTRVANMGSELDVEERNLLSVAFKNVVGARRSAWRSIFGMMQKEDPANPYFAFVNDYKNKVEAELVSKCKEPLNLLKKADGLIATSTNSESLVFYLKMEGDYHRYLAEFANGADGGAHAANALNAYTQATNNAQALPATHPIRLGLALNFSVFYYEVYQKAYEACAVAKAAFEQAIAEAETLPEGMAQDSGAIMKLLRDNLQLWQESAATQADGTKPPEQDGTLCEDL